MIDTDVAYCAGIIDGEGYIGIKKSKPYECTERKTPGYEARIQVRMVDEQAICFLCDTLGGWYYREKPSAANGRPLYCWQVGHIKAETAIRLVLPYLRVKRAPAEAVLALRDLQANARQHRTKIVGYREFPNAQGVTRVVANKSYSDEYVAECERLWLLCREINRVGVAE